MAYSNEVANMAAKKRTHYEKNTKNFFARKNMPGMPRLPQSVPKPL